MDTFLELLKESVIIRGTLALGFSAVILTMYLVGKDVPKELVGMEGVILAFFYNAVANQTAQRAADKAVKKYRQGGE